MYVASQQGHARACQILVASGANVNLARAVRLEPCLHNDSKRRRLLCPRLARFPSLLNAYERPLLAVNMQVDGATPLLAASEAGHVEVVRLLLAAGAHVNQSKTVGLKKGDRNVRRDDYGMVGTRLNLTSPLQVDGASPLFVAAQAGHTHIATLLLRHGAEVNQARTVSLLPISNTTDPYKARSAVYTHPPLAPRCSCPCINPQGCGASPLFVAAQQGHTAMVQLLLDHGAGASQARRVSRN